MVLIVDETGDAKTSGASLNRATPRPFRPRGPAGGRACWPPADCGGPWERESSWQAQKPHASSEGKAGKRRPCQSATP